jgi:hypothetical protein
VTASVPKMKLVNFNLRPPEFLSYSVSYLEFL